MPSLLGSMLGSQAAQNLFGYNTYNSAYNQNQLGSAAHSAAMAAQQQAMYNAMLNQRQHHWMINGKSMDFDEFVDTLCPDADDPMRTFLILKYKK